MAPCFKSTCCSRGGPEFSSQDPHWQSTRVCRSSSGGSNALFWPLAAPGRKCTHTYREIKINPLKTTQYNSDVGRVRKWTPLVTKPWEGATPRALQKSLRTPDRRRETVSNPIFSPAPRGPSRLPGHPAHSRCAPSAAGRGDPQTPRAAPSVFPPSSREPGDLGEERDAPHRRRDPRFRRRWHRGPLSPPLGPPGTRSPHPAERGGLASEPLPARPPARARPLTVAAASSRRPSLQAAPSRAPGLRRHTGPRRPPPLPASAEPQATPPEAGWPRPGPRPQVSALRPGPARQPSGVLPPDGRLTSGSSRCALRFSSPATALFCPSHWI